MHLLDRGTPYTNLKDRLSLHEKSYFLHEKEQEDNNYDMDVLS